jgi:hypothetical protein
MYALKVVDNGALVTHLEVNYNFAHGLAQEPSLRHVPDHGGRKAEENDEEVSDSQIDNENIRHGPHRVVRPNGEAYERVSYLQK